MEIIPEKKKRGRKAKTEVKELIENTTIKYPKKRGRKPKGGKVVVCEPDLEKLAPSKINIILHLKCNKSDLDNNNNSNLLENFKFSESKLNNLNYMSYNNKLNNTNNPSTSDNDNDNDSDNDNDHDNAKDNNNDNNNENDNMKNIWKKIDKLSNNLHLNNICDKKAACFFCTYEFDNNPIYIPKYELNNKYHVYGCFCSPECACAFLMNEQNIDDTTRFERYYLLNYLYCKIYEYSKNIKPAPCPYYMLDKYYGNLSIQEYRKLLKNERLLLIVDKPLTRILPELHEDTDDYLLNNQGIKPQPSQKYMLYRKNIQKSKNDIVNQQFNLQ